MKFALCDDNPYELKQMTAYLLQFDPSAVFETFLSAEEILGAFRSDFYDVVLLDIEMDGLNGYQAAVELNHLDKIPLIIFITKSGAYSIRGYEVAFRYLQKPVLYSDFERALAAAVQKLTPKRIGIIENGDQIILSVQDILYVEVFNYNLTFHTLHGCHSTRSSLKAIEDDLSGNQFTRPHNSYLVNLAFIDQVHQNMIQLTDGTKIPLSRSRKKQFDEALFRFFRR